MSFDFSCYCFLVTISVCIYAITLALLCSTFFFSIICLEDSDTIVRNPFMIREFQFNGFFILSERLVVSFCQKHAMLPEAKSLNWHHCCCHYSHSMCIVKVTIHENIFWMPLVCCNVVCKQSAWLKMRRQVKPEMQTINEWKRSGHGQTKECDNSSERAKKRSIIEERILFVNIIVSYCYD